MLNAADIRKLIYEKIPHGTVLSRHTEHEHFYEIRDTDELRAQPKEFAVGPVLPSVTGKLQVVKDESLVNYKMNRVLDYVFSNWSKFTEENVMDHLAQAKLVPAGILEDAGNIGTAIHDARQAYFTRWMETGSRPDNLAEFVAGSPAAADPRLISGLRAIEKFCVDHGYIPVACEIPVWEKRQNKLGEWSGVAGTLDDIGLMRKQIKKGVEGCVHQLHEGTEDGGCVLCGYRFRYELVLMDLKTSNRFKDHYFLQVALYYFMFKQLTGLKPTRCFILKASKEDGSYKIEDLESMPKLLQFTRATLRMNEGITYIRSVRKDNQKNVITI